MYAFSENFRAADLARRGGAHEGVASRGRCPGDDWQPAGGGCGAFYGVSAGPPGEEAARSWGRSWASGTSGTPPGSWTGTCWTDPENQQTPRSSSGRSTRFYLSQTAALWEVDFSTGRALSGWSPDDNHNNVVVFVRRDRKGRELIAAVNFSPVGRTDYRFGVPPKKTYREVFTTDTSRIRRHGRLAQRRRAFDRVHPLARQALLAVRDHPAARRGVLRGRGRMAGRGENQRAARGVTGRQRNKEERTSVKKECIAMLLAGGQGSRLYVLTGDYGEARRAVRREVPHHRLSAVQLRQFAGIDTVGVLTQYRPAGAEPLHRLAACRGTWTGSDRRRAHPAAVSWAARAVRRGTRARPTPSIQNIGFVDLYDPEYVVILSGDHIYKMDYAKMVARHKAAGAACTISVMEVPWAEASALRHHERGRERHASRSSQEKPKRSPRATWRRWASTSSRGRRCVRYLMED